MGDEGWPRVAATRRLADEWALVLIAEGLSPAVVREPGGFVLRVPAHQEERAAQILRVAEASARQSVEAKMRSLKEHEQQQLRVLGEELSRRSQENSELTKKRVEDLRNKATEKSAAAAEFIYEEFLKAVL